MIALHEDKFNCVPDRLFVRGRYEIEKSERPEKKSLQCRGNAVDQTLAAFTLW